MRKFQRRIEDFACMQCGTQVTGDGYTNHCPACLWSRHVDIAPGDRAAECGGAMRPTASERRGDDWYVAHRCETCGFQRKNRIRPEETAALIKLSRDWSRGS